jgi:glycerophosphoryl diester phosphodiesterase
VEISGHRGARALWPENTLPGFRGALTLGVDTLELDAMLTADAQLVVTHDFRPNPELCRLDGAWAPPDVPVRALSLAELRALDVGRAAPGSRVAARFPRQVPCDGARIPLLAEVLALRAPLDIELKTRPDDAESCDPLALADAVLALLGEERQAIRSFDFRGLHHVRALRPHWALGWLTHDADGLNAVLERARPGDAWAPAYATLRPELVAQAQAAGLAVKPWTVNQVQDAERLVQWGVDGLCTDAPDVVGRGGSAPAQLHAEDERGQQHRRAVAQPN